MFREKKKLVIEQMKMKDLEKDKNLDDKYCGEEQGIHEFDEEEGGIHEFDEEERGVQIDQNTKIVQENKISHSVIRGATHSLKKPSPPIQYCVALS